MIKRAISGAILVLVLLFMVDNSPRTYYLLWAILLGLTLIEFYSLLARYGSRLGRSKRAWSILGGLYIAAGYGSLMFCFGVDRPDVLSEQGRMMVITTLTLVWANDVGAYLVGSSIGRHKMAPKISPKKSWEGFFGGLACAVGVGVLWAQLFWSKIASLNFELLFVDLTQFFAFMGLVAALAAVGGDLIESAFKRKLAIKDSGSIIPGHGGMLDRFDALILAAPAVVIYMYFMS